MVYDSAASSPSTSNNKMVSSTAWTSTRTAELTCYRSPARPPSSSLVSSRCVSRGRRDTRFSRADVGWKGRRGTEGERERDGRRERDKGLCARCWRCGRRRGCTWGSCGGRIAVCSGGSWAQLCAQACQFTTSSNRDVPLPPLLPAGRMICCGGATAGDDAREKHERSRSGVRSRS